MKSRARSAEAKAWQHLYWSARWQRLRAAQLARAPLCEWCKKCGRVTAAAVVHHVQKHSGNEALFFEGKLESLCKLCHDSSAQAEERLGYSTEIGLDGFPVDPRHPANAGQATP